MHISGVVENSQQREGNLGSDLPASESHKRSGDEVFNPQRVRCQVFRGEAPAIRGWRLRAKLPAAKGKGSGVEVPIVGRILQFSIKITQFYAYFDQNSYIF